MRLPPYLLSTLIKVKPYPFLQLPPPGESNTGFKVVSVSPHNKGKSRVHITMENIRSDHEPEEIQMLVKHDDVYEVANYLTTQPVFAIEGVKIKPEDEPEE